MVEVEIEDDIALLIKKKCEQTQFDSVEEYISFVLQELLRQEKSEPETETNRENPPEKRLKDLGYL